MTYTYTSAEAGKVLKSLQLQKSLLLEREEKTNVFTAALEENIEDLRPEYDFAEVQEELVELDRKIRVLKHAISTFNLKTDVPEFGMTVDQMLVYIPQLQNRKQKLSEMQSRLAKERKDPNLYEPSNFIEYTIANYNVEEANKAYLAVAEELSRAQLALDKVNLTETFTVEL